MTTDKNNTLLSDVWSWFQDIADLSEPELTEKITTALAHDNDTLKADPTDENALLRKALCLHLLGKHQDALTVVDKYLSDPIGILWAKSDFEQLRKLSENALKSSVVATNHPEVHGGYAKEHDLSAAAEEGGSETLSNWIAGLAILLFIALLFGAGLLITGIFEDKPAPLAPCKEWGYREKTVDIYEGQVVNVEEYDPYCIRR